MSDTATTEGHWVTIQGAHVHIGKGGKIDKGPKGLTGKTHAEATSHAKEHSHDHSAASQKLLGKYVEQSGGDTYGSAHQSLQNYASGKQDENSGVWAHVHGQTQEKLSASGTESMTLYRGLALRSDHPIAKGLRDGTIKPGDTVELDAPAAQSYSEHQSEAKRFAEVAPDKGAQHFGIVVQREAAAKDIIGGERFSKDFLDGEGEVIAQHPSGKIRVKVVSVHDDHGVAKHGASMSLSQSSGLWLGPVADVHTEATEDGLTYWKDILTVGEYIHPRDGKKFGITEDLYGDLEASFAERQAIGDEPPLLFDHHDGAKEVAKNTAGYIKALRRDGGRLQAKVQFADEESRKIGLRNKVSVRVLPNVRDTTGKVHPLALTHVALTPRPVLTNLNDWNLALSRDGEGAVPEPYFAAPTPNKDFSMTAEQLERAKKIVPTATDENAIDLLLSFAETESANSDKNAEDLKKAKADVAALKAKTPLELSQTELAFGKRAIKGDLIEVTAKWPQVAKDAAIKYATDESRTGLMLSAVGDGRTGIDDFADFCRAIPLKGLLAHDTETTAGQALELSRVTPDAPGTNDLTKLGDQQGQAIVAQRLAQMGIKATA